MADTWLTTNETVAQLGVSSRTLNRYAASGRIKSNKVGSSVFYDLESFIERELEKAEAEDKLITAPFIAVVYDSRQANIVRGQAIAPCRPSITFMTSGVRHDQPDGSSQMTWNLVIFSIGANLDRRLTPELITGEDWNAVVVQPAAKKLVESGVLKVFYPEANSIKYENSYRAYSHSDAMELVANTYSIFDLDRYSLGEDRKVILAAIVAQRLEIEQQLERNNNTVMNVGDHARNFKR